MDVFVQARAPIFTQRDSQLACQPTPRVDVVANRWRSATKTIATRLACRSNATGLVIGIIVIVIVIAIVSASVIVTSARDLRIGLGRVIVLLLLILIVGVFRSRQPAMR
jgi:hypothetical protein